MLASAEFAAADYRFLWDFCHSRQIFLLSPTKGLVVLLECRQATTNKGASNASRAASTRCDVGCASNGLAISQVVIFGAAAAGVDNQSIAAKYVPKPRGSARS